MKLSKISILLAAAAFATTSSMAASLNIGDKAPALSVAKWFKGKETKAFQPGKTYVVEFWATWCGPCKVSIPHLTEMAKKFGDKVTFIGVSVWEQPNATDNSYFDKVDAFVKSMGDKMDYNVAGDGFEGKMAKSWMQAAGEDGIPSAFIVDGTGTIVWIGHPMAGLDDVLSQVLAGKWDYRDYAKKRAAEMQMQEDQMKIVQLAQAGKFEEAVAACDECIKKYPEASSMISDMKFSLLLEVDEKKAYAFAKEVCDAAKTEDDARILNSMAWTMVDNAELKSPDYPLALAIAKKASALTKDEDPMILDTLATCYFKAGDKANAIKTERKAIELFKKSGGDADTLKEFEARLKEFGG